MNFDWNQIGEKIFSLYEEMDYHSDYNIERFKTDLEIERSKDVCIPECPGDDMEHSLSWLLWFRDILESRRSILTKFFNFTNNPNSVDILIGYCDYYKSYYDNLQTNNNPVISIPCPSFLLYDVFMMLAKNEITETVLLDVWRMLCTPTKILTLFHKLDVAFQCGPLAMVIMADCDLNAAVRALIESFDTCFQVSGVLVQEPVKEQLLSTISNLGYEIETSDLYVFRHTAEVLEDLKDKFTCVSIWSENIIAAKKFSANLEIGTIWINAHGVLSAGLHSMIYVPINKFDSTDLPRILGVKGDYNSQKTAQKPSKTYNLFYGGKWHIPVDKTYRTNEAGVSFAQATVEDAINCANAARGAFKLWRSKKLSERAKIMRCFAERLRANGETEYADIVLQLVDRPLEVGTSLSIVRDGEAEILSTREPVGVVTITTRDQKMLFAKLIIASVTGNAVIIVLNSNSTISFAPYCDFLGTCGFPPGVINCLFATDTMSLIIGTGSRLMGRLISESTASLLPNFADLYKDRAGENIVYNYIYSSVTKAKSVWLQCA